ncbi:MAG: FAD:protein FMN transferase, partial [Acidimicrobiia bacterium]|nr:FAD:protein FMN transferase [Acidimicrobiia bacterium]
PSARQIAVGSARGAIRTLQRTGQVPAPGQLPVDPDRGPVAAIAFEALGTSCRVVVGGSADDAGLAAAATDRVRHFERRWSRFLPDSEVSQLNRRPGRLTIVSPSTFDLVLRAEQARIATSGRFNPLLLDQLEAAGYRRSWLDCRPGADGGGVDAMQSPGLGTTGPGSDEPIELLAEVHGVRLPAGTRFDPGGIGKGLAVDRVTEWCRGEGATTVCVDLGGDLRVHGEPWYGPRWRIGVDHPLVPGVELGAFTPAEGAVTTSTSLRRTWAGPGGERLHHLIDPGTGRPSASDVVAVTTCSSQAWWAEVAAKAALLAGSGGALGVLAELGTPGIAVTAAGGVLRWDGGPRPHDVARHSDGAAGGGAGRTAG